MYIYLIRHGQSFPSDEEKKWQGVKLNPSLTKEGIQQSRDLLNMIKHPISKIFSSKLLRSVQTAKPLADLNKISIKTYESLNEIDLGDFENLTTKEIETRYPDLYANLIKKEFTFSFPSGESFINLSNRLDDIIKEIENSDENLAIFSHNYVLQLLISRLIKIDFRNEIITKLDLGSVTLLKMNNAKIFELIYFNKIKGTT